MIISSHLFSETQGQFLPPASSLGSKFPFQVSAKFVQSIDVVSFTVAVIPFSVIHQSMNKSLKCDISIYSPGIRTHGGFRKTRSDDERLQDSCLNVVHNPGPYDSIATEIAKKGLFLVPLPLFYPHLMNRFSFVFPLTSKIGFIDFNRSQIDIRNLFDHG